MKTLLFLFTMLNVFSFVNAQSDLLQQNFTPIREELQNWDPIRGQWLADGMIAMSQNQPVPDRTFPEDLTPFEMMKLVPSTVREKISGTAKTQLRNAPDTQTAAEWTRINGMFDRTLCKPVSSRSYGDPHLSSFDGATYSFQTVGEFVLVKSPHNNLEVQTRQQARQDDFSLNTAVAMNVSGDRVCIYANEKPDNFLSSALRVNGNPVQISGDTYFLSHGGTVTYSNNVYMIKWPTGETLTAEMRHSGTMNFLNIAVQIFPCAQNDIFGLLGNANGSSHDDFDSANSKMRPSYGAFSTFGNDGLQQVNNQLEKEYLAFLARDFARTYRITQENSLFDYSVGQNTLTYTDESFPKVHRTVADLDPQSQAQARKKCEEEGVRGDEIKGCIFDNAYLNIPPSPKPVFHDQTNGMVLGKLDRPVVNVNPGNPKIEKQVKDKGIVNPPVPQSIEKVKPTINPEKNSEIKHDMSHPKTEILSPKKDFPSQTPSKSSPPAAPKPTVKPQQPSVPAKPGSVIKSGKG